MTEYRRVAAEVTTGERPCPTCDRTAAGHDWLNCYDAPATPSQPAIQRAAEKAAEKIEQNLINWTMAERPARMAAIITEAVGGGVPQQDGLLQIVRSAAELGCLRGRQVHCAERESNSADWCVACQAKYVLREPRGESRS